jgi:hypothetical protein
MRFGTYHVFQCPPGRRADDVIREELARAELADALGFDDIWVPEQHFSPYCLAGDALLLAGQLTARTRRVRVGTAVVNLTFTHPLRFVERVALLDHVTGGRWTWGLGAATSSRSTACSACPSTRRGRSSRRPTWCCARERREFDYQGRHYPSRPSASGLLPCGLGRAAVHAVNSPEAWHARSHADCRTSRRDLSAPPSRSRRGRATGLRFPPPTRRSCSPARPCSNTRSSRPRVPGSALAARRAGMGPADPPAPDDPDRARCRGYELYERRGGAPGVRLRTGSNTRSCSTTRMAAPRGDTAARWRVELSSDGWRRRHAWSWLDAPLCRARGSAVPVNRTPAEEG